jgi:hypothetical protein
VRVATCGTGVSVMAVGVGTMVGVETMIGVGVSSGVGTVVANKVKPPPCSPAGVGVTLIAMVLVLWAHPVRAGSRMSDTMQSSPDFIAPPHPLSQDIRRQRKRAQ